MKPGDAILIKYHKSHSTDDPPLRTIIPIDVPKQLVLALDISELMANGQIEDCRNLSAQVTEYDEYRKLVLSQLMTFDQWRDMVYSDTSPVTYRSFTPSGIEIVNQ